LGPLDPPPALRGLQGHATGAPVNNWLDVILSCRGVMVNSSSCGAPQDALWTPTCLSVSYSHSLTGPPTEQRRTFSVCHRASAARRYGHLNQLTVATSTAEGEEARTVEGHDLEVMPWLVPAAGPALRDTQILQQPRVHRCWPVNGSNWFVQLTITITADWCALVRNANWTQRKPTRRPY